MSSEDEKAAEEYASEWAHPPGCYPFRCVKEHFLAGVEHALRGDWTSVERGLPPHSPNETKLYLVWVVGDKGAHAETSMLYPSGEWSHIRSKERVTHWMSLPKPPEAESDE